MKSHLKSALLAAAFFLPFSGGAAFAATDPIGAIFRSTPFTLPEVGETIGLGYILTNNTTGAITISSIRLTLNTSGDASDAVNLGSNPNFLGSCHNMSLAPGGTCITQLNLTVDNGTGETDGDSGVNIVSMTFGTFNFALSTGPLDTTITITDPPITTTTPLPSAFPLFATGLGALGLLGWHRKRKLRVSPR